jgi:integrase
MPSVMAADPLPANSASLGSGPASAGGAITEADIAAPRAPVTLDGVTLFSVRGEESPRKETYTEQEYRAILTKAAPADCPVFALLANTGLRSSEAAMLEWGDVDRSGMLCIRRSSSQKCR